MIDLSPARLYALIAVWIGTASYFAEVYAERWHSRQFSEHTRRLRRYAEADDDEAISAEVRRFHEDQRIDYAILVMQYAPILAIVCFGITAMILIGA